MNYALLPIDIQHIILEFEGSIKYRNGKYMNQISHNIMNDMEFRIKNIPNRWMYQNINEENIFIIIKKLNDKKELFVVIYEDRVIYNYYYSFYHGGIYIRN